MAREYVAVMAANASTFTTTNPFFQLIAPATTGLTLFGFELTQEGSTTSAVVVARLSRRTATSVTGLGTAITPTRLAPNDAAASATAASGISTSAGAGQETVGRWGFNALSGLPITYVPETRPHLAPSGFWTMEFVGTPGLTWSLNFYFEENV